MEPVTVSPKFQVVIPRNVRLAMGIRPGEKFQVFQVGDRIEYIPVRKMKTMRGFLKGIDTRVNEQNEK